MRLQYVATTSKDRLTVTNPFNSQVVTSAVEVAGAAEIDAAVAAAKRAYYQNGWKGTPGAVRSSLLFRLADLMERDAEKLSRLEVLGSGNAFTMVAQRGFGSLLKGLRRKPAC
jgi:acyl-CoA reductase-like NAD-dependent aldehyde dehydrogenase